MTVKVGTYKFCGKSGFVFKSVNETMSHHGGSSVSIVVCWSVESTKLLTIWVKAKVGAGSNVS